MIHRIKIATEHDPRFELCWDLYNNSFPQDERRDREYHLETLARDDFSFEAIYDDAEFIGLIGWWQFDSVRYVEHLATLPTLRNRGYGKLIIDHFIGGGDDVIILEVEHPTCPVSQRRIGFYQRSGFALNDYSYSHPSYQVQSDDFVSLMLMSYPHALSADACDAFKCECYRRVHFRHVEQI